MPVKKELVVTSSEYSVGTQPLPRSARNELPPSALFMLLFGCYSIIYGVLLIPILNGSLRSDSEAATAMFVVVFAIMIGFLGLTPVGSFGESRFLLAIGFVLALFGSVAFVSPGTLHHAMSYVLAVMLLALGLIRLPTFAYELRREPSAVPRAYSIPYMLMHLLCLVVGLQIVLHWPRGMLMPLLIALGICQLMLGIEAARKGWRVPQPGPDRLGHPLSGPVQMSMRSRLMLLLGLMMLFMAVLVTLAVERLIPYDGQRMSIGFVVIMAFQIMLVGSTPIHDFTPSWPLTLLGFAMASAAMVASILPGLIDGALGTLIGVSNLLTAVLGYVHLVGSIRQAVSMPAGPDKRIVMRVIGASALTYALLIVFGMNILVPHVIPGKVMLLVLVAAGFSLAWLSTLLDKMPEPAGPIREN